MHYVVRVEEALVVEGKLGLQNGDCVLPKACRATLWHCELRLRSSSTQARFATSTLPWEYLLHLRCRPARYLGSFEPAGMASDLQGGRQRSHKAFERRLSRRGG